MWERLTADHKWTIFGQYSYLHIFYDLCIMIPAWSLTSGSYFDITSTPTLVEAPNRGLIRAYLGFSSGRGIVGRFGIGHHKVSGLKIRV